MDEAICKTCGNCNHSEEDSFDPNFLKCNGIKHSNSFDSFDLSKDVLAFTNDCEDKDSTLWVRRNFGCILFKEKQTPEKNVCQNIV